MAECVEIHITVAALEPARTEAYKRLQRSSRPFPLTHSPKSG